MSKLHLVRLVAIVICAARALAQPPDTATLDTWWRGVVANDQATQAASRARLQEHAEPAVRRGMELLRAGGKPSGQGLAFAIAGLGDPAWVALQRECADTSSPVRALALEGMLWLRSNHFENRRDHARLEQALRETVIGCLDSEDEDVLRQLRFAISSVDDAMKAMLEQKLVAPAPVGPRAALFLDERPPHPPLPALLAALDDSSASMQATALSALGKRSDAEARAGMLRFLRRAGGDTRQAAAYHLAMRTDEPLDDDLVALLIEFVGAALPAPLARDWFEDLSARERAIEAFDGARRGR